MSLEPTKRVLVITAHPDDAEFTCGGTLAKWAAAGHEIRYVLCTSGDKGTKNPKLQPDQLALIREQEQEEAAKELGAASCTFLRYKDGELEVTLAFRAELARVLRQMKPDIVLTHDPWIHYQIHPDHRAAGQAVVEAIASARDQLYFPEQLAEGLEAHRVKELYLFMPQEPNFWVDIRDTFDQKMAALSRHQSQVGNWPPEELRKRVRQWAVAEALYQVLRGAAPYELRDRLRQWAAALDEAQGPPLAESFRRLEPR